MDRETIKRQIQLYHSDCLVGMERVESGSVDLILCDLPYGTTDCSWDTVIPFEPLWAQYRRVLKPRGAAVLMAAQPFATDLINSARKLFRYDLVWEKSAPVGFANCMGSGTTAVAALNTGRRFIGFERELNYYQTACRRVADRAEELTAA